MRNFLLTLMLLASFSFGASAQESLAYKSSHSEQNASAVSALPGGTPADAIKTYPNPVVHDLHIIFNNEVFSLKGWQLQDLLGNIVLKGKVTKPMGNLKIDLSNQSSEIYYYDFMIMPAIS